MTVVLLLVPLAVLLAGLFLVGFVWSVRTGQLDDMDTPARRMLHDDDAGRAPGRAAPREQAGMARHRTG